MSAKTNNFKIGLFVLFGVALLFAALFAFGIRSQFEPKTLFETYMTEDVEGLSVGSAVKLRGVPVGKVNRIHFTWNSYPGGTNNYVMVEFEIKNSVSPLPPGKPGDDLLLAEIRKGLRARVKAQGITGTSILSLEYLEPGKHPPLQVQWKPRAHYIPSAPGQFSQMLDSIEKSLQNVEKLDFEKLGSALQESLEGMRAVFDHVEQLQFASIGTNVNSLLTELRVTNGKLQTFLDETQGTVESMQLGDLSQNANVLLERLVHLAGKVETTLDGVGSAPIRDTVVEARAALDQLSAVLRDLKRYPSGFIFGDPPAPARSVERRKTQP